MRRRNDEWLTKWEPSRIPGQPDVVEDQDAFAVRCSARQRERQLGTGYGFGIFVDGEFAGEINLSSVQRGPFQSAYVGYWIDEKQAGNGYMPEALVVLLASCSRSCACTGCRSPSSPATRPAAGSSRS